MSNLQEKTAALVQLGAYMLSGDPAWQEAKEHAVQRNQWFTAEHIELATKNIVNGFLQAGPLAEWSADFTLPEAPKTVGITMAGNIPMVGFHDFLCGYISGHRLRIKYASRDEVLIPFLVRQLAQWDPSVTEQVQRADMLKHCDAYIATGSNNSSRYFEQYFAKYPHIIRRNRTSVAVLDGTESPEELNALADDVFIYFGLGCRNVTQVCVPAGYDFQPLMHALGRYSHLMNHHKYRNNFDFHLAVYLLNLVPYMTNDSVLLVANDIPFASVSVLHYRYYTDKAQLLQELRDSSDIQCIAGKEGVPFGRVQQPGLRDYADGVDVMAFLASL
jgi:hypothetical protein